MKHYISTDKEQSFGWTENIPHKKENWESPLMDKLNRAHDYLRKLPLDGEYYCHFNSSTQMFSVKYELCNDMTEEEIYSLTTKINDI